MVTGVVNVFLVLSNHNSMGIFQMANETFSIDQVELTISCTRKYIVAGSLSFFLAGNSDVSCCSP